MPVINALTDDHHPCQALADCLTLREHFGSLDGLTLAYVGDGNNVAHSLIEAAHLTGMNLRLATPPGCLPDPSILAAAGRSVRILDTPDEAVAGAHAVYTDVWVSMGKEAGGERPQGAARGLPGHAGADGARAPRRRLPALPARAPRRRGRQRGDRRPASLVWQQAANRLPTEQALLSALVTGDWEV